MKHLAWKKRLLGTPRLQTSLISVKHFLHFRLWGGYSWPDFNLADSFIVVGVGVLLLELLASEGENRARAEPDEPPV